MAQKVQKSPKFLSKMSYKFLIRGNKASNRTLQLLSVQVKPLQKQLNLVLKPILDRDPRWKSVKVSQLICQNPQKRWLGIRIMSLRIDRRRLKRKTRLASRSLNSKSATGLIWQAISIRTPMIAKAACRDNCRVSKKYWKLKKRIKITRNSDFNEFDSWK